VIAVNRVALVAWQEFSVHARRRGFLFSAFGVPLLIIVLLVVITQIATAAETDTTRIGTVGYVDRAEIVTAEAGFTPYADEEAARAALNDGTIGAYFVLEPDYVDTGRVRLYSMTEVPDVTTDDIERVLITSLSASVSDETLLARVQDPLNMQVRTLDTGRTLGEAAVFAVFFIPFIFVFVVLMSTQISGGYLMSGVVEEKTNRIMEILITSLTPFQLLLGKILGLGALGLVQLLAWIGIGVGALLLGQGSDLFAGIGIPVDLMVLGLVLFLLTYTLYASFAAGVGVIVGSEQESRQVASIFSLGFSLPFFFIVNFMTDPNGALPVALTLFPLTAPLSILLRVGFGMIPAWQLALSLVLLSLTTLLVVWASARLFRWGLLRYGKRASLREVWRALRRAPRISTTAQ
jgi:ABC-2 type transport system permease protein